VVRATPLSLPDVILLESRAFTDDRGFFTELYRAEHFAALGLPTQWVQDNRSRSRAQVVRGLHYALRTPQAKLVTCVRGAVFDVVVDVRVGSPTFGNWVSVELDETPGRALYIPAGFAHGFCALRDDTELVYKCTAAYDPSDDLGVHWSDAALAIPWPASLPIVSGKDQQQPTLAEAQGRGLLPIVEP
jgi:dTDP-4-dehydrorhamnose 3,5-epimerase